MSHHARWGLGLVAVMMAGAADARPLTPAMTCAAAQATVARQGAIVLSTSATTYDRYVADRRFCQITETTRPAWVPAKDTSQCFVGYICKEAEPWWDD